MASTETETILNKVKQTKNEKDREGNWVKKAFRYLRWPERTRIENEINQSKRGMQAAAWTGMSDEGRQNMSKRVLGMERQLREESPPTDLSGDTKDALAKRCKELETQIREGMPPHEVMRRNPVGAVDAHRKWEVFNKTRILEWKNVMRALNPTSDERDLANVERLRPTITGPGQDPTVMVESQIPGYFSYHTVDANRWKETFGEQPTKGALGEVERLEAADTGAEDLSHETVLPEEPVTQGPGRPRKAK